MICDKLFVELEPETRNQKIDVCGKGDGFIVCPGCFWGAMTNAAAGEKDVSALFEDAYMLSIGKNSQDGTCFSAAAWKM